MPWATADNVAAITGETVTEEWVTRASYIIETITNRAPTDAVKPRDARALGRAVVYQAAWMLTQPDLFGRMEITQTGSSSSSTAFTDMAVVLAPLAKLALNSCSWNRSHTIPVKNGMTRPLCDESEDFDSWATRWEMA